MLNYVPASPSGLGFDSALIFLEFYKLVRGISDIHDSLYIYFRSSLASMMEWYDVRIVFILQDFSICS